MQIKTILLASLSLGTTWGRFHGHHRRHAELHAERSAAELNERETELNGRKADLNERQAGAIVIVTMNGQVVSWTNEWTGEPATTAPPPPPPPPPAATTTSVASAVNNAAPTATSAPSNPVSDTTNVNPLYLPTLNKISNAFCPPSAPSGTPGSIDYVGNVGQTWGCNIIQIAEADVGNFQYVLAFTGQDLTEPWLVNFWNKIGPHGGLNGWYGNSALAFTLGPNENKYVALDSNSQVGFAAAPGGNIPVDSYGGTAATWGECDAADAGNNGWSGCDVSCIQAQAAGLQVQGMQICGNGVCSSVTPGAAQVNNAYYQNAAQDAQGGIGLNIPPGPFQVQVMVNYGG